MRDVAQAVRVEALVADSQGGEPGKDGRQVTDDVEPFEVDFGFDADSRAAMLGEGREIAEVRIPGETVRFGEEALIPFGLCVCGGDGVWFRPVGGDGVGVLFAEHLVRRVAEKGDPAAGEGVGAKEVGIGADGAAARTGAHGVSFPSAPGDSAPNASRHRWISAAFSYFCCRMAFFSSRSRYARESVPVVSAGMLPTCAGP